MLPSHRVLWVQQRKAVAKVSDRAADLVIFVVGLRVLDVVAAHHVVFTMALVRLPFEKINLPEKPGVIVSSGRQEQGEGGRTFVHGA